MHQREPGLSYGFIELRLKERLSDRKDCRTSLRFVRNDIIFRAIAIQADPDVKIDEVVVNPIPEIPQPSV